MEFFEQFIDLSA